MKRIRLPIWLLSILFVFSALPAFSEGTLTLPASLKKIGNRAFEGDSSFTKISFGPDVTSVGQYAFSNCDGLNELVVPSHIGTINAYAFQDCDDLRIVTIESGVNTIGNHAFYGCDSLSALTINQGIDTIGSYAFSECDGLTELTLGSEIGTIDEYAFSNCDGLITLTIGSGIETIGKNAFSDCDLLNKVTFQSSVNSLSPTAFSACSALTSLVFTAGEVNYPSGTFPATVKSLTFEKDVETVYASSFMNCTGLERLVFNGPKTKIEGDFSFIQSDQVTVIAPFAGDASALIDGEKFISPTYRALLIGQQYKGATQKNPATGQPESIELHGCIEDALSLGRLLQNGIPYIAEKFSIVPIAEYSDEVTVITEKKKEQIINAISEKLATTSEDDVSLLYYSGHGAPGGYLIGTHEGNVGFDQYIDPSELYNAFKKNGKLKGKYIVVVDACYSGGLIGRGLSDTVNSFTDDFIKGFSLSSRSAELADDHFFVIVAASEIYGSGESVTVSKDGIPVGLFTYWFERAFGWDRTVDGDEPGDWIDETVALSMPADSTRYRYVYKNKNGQIIEDLPIAGYGNEDGFVTLNEAFLYADTMVKEDQRHYSTQQVTKVWPDQENEDWPEAADIILCGWVKGETPESGE